MLRFFHSSCSFYNISKNALSKLRKKTGYTFANCRKALELHGNDVTQAEKWLHEQAQALGWSKATKLEGRPTVQGLVGITFDKNKTSMVEVNCETDFVARNNKFKSIVELVTTTAMQSVAPSTDEPISKVLLSSEQLRSLKAEDGKHLADHLALLIGSVGENITLKRGICINISPSISIAGYTHPAPNNTFGILTGKYGSLVAYKSDPNYIQEGKISIDEIGRRLCQHVIGMNPSKIGRKDEDTARENIDDETIMIHQEYLLDPSITVGELLENSGIELLDFVRYECGESRESESSESSEGDKIAAVESA